MRLRRTTHDRAAATGQSAAWHTKPGAEAVSDLKSSNAGLTASEAARRLDEHGPNALPAARTRRWWRSLARQFASPLIAVLGAAAALSASTGHTADACLIGAVLLVNALIGGVQEWRAERSAKALQKLLRFNASVKRDGAMQEIDATAVVPGDIVWLESGFRVPADARILEASGLEVDESLLTGESLAVEKDATWIAPAEGRTPVADRRNMVHAGTTVVRGSASAIVVATGRASSVGSLASDVIEARAGIPPLVLRLKRFSRTVGIAALALSAAVALIGIAVHGHAPADMAILGAALAVSIIPEGLPVAVTIALAIASSRMAKRRVVVRHLGAVEGLGSCTLIASDKTGTLTCNELTVREIALPSGTIVRYGGQGYAPVGGLDPAEDALDETDRAALRTLNTIAVLCNHASLEARDGGWTWRGDPTDVALLSMARKGGSERATELVAHPECRRITFAPERRFAATFHRFDHETWVMVKGAPEQVLAMCGEGTADAGARSPLQERAQEMAGRGLRVLAFACGAVAERATDNATSTDPGGLDIAGLEGVHLRVAGLAGMIDPLREGAREAVRSCEVAGVATCMITGDHPRTALSIARELGIARDAGEVMTGDAFDARSDEEVRAALEPTRSSGHSGGDAAAASRIRVLARATPAQKLRLVRVAGEAGHFVAVTGDGANDAPALKAASIGVAMGVGGTDIARDAADLILGDDNFASIVAGVEEGRIAYDNIRKVVFLLISTNAAEALMIVVAFGAGLPLPLLPSQLLWLNLATEGLQDVALAFEPGEDGVLRRAPRQPHEPIFDRLMVERLLLGACVVGGLSLGAYWWMLREGSSVEEARNTLLLLMVLFENVQAANSRSETRSLFALRPFGNPYLAAAVVASFALHLSAMHMPVLQRALGTAPVGGDTWLACAGLALVVLVASEAQKAWWRMRAAR